MFIFVVLSRKDVVIPHLMRNPENSQKNRFPLTNCGNDKKRGILGANRKEESIF